MEESKHPIPPWEYRADGTVRDADDQVVCVPVASAGPIVAAAPLMLEALRKWDDFGLKMWGREFTPETVKEFSKLWSATSGAIKAATGGEP